MTSSLTRLVKPSIIIGCLATGGIDSVAAIICDGIPVPVTLKASVPTLSVLSSNTAQLVFQLESPLGDDTHLALHYTGTARNGFDFALLPASVLIPAFQTSTKLTINPEATYPFASKTLTVTI